MVKLLSLQSYHSAFLTSFQGLYYSPKPNIPTFNSSKCNWSLFCEILNKVHFSFVFSSSDINSIGSNLKSILLQSSKLAILMTRLHFYNCSKGPKKWCDDESRVAGLAKQKACKMFQKHPSQSTAISYKQSCLKVKLLCRTAKQGTLLNFISIISFGTIISKVHNFVSQLNNGKQPIDDHRYDIIQDGCPIVSDKRRQICLIISSKMSAQIFIPSNLLFAIPLSPVHIKVL